MFATITEHLGNLLKGISLLATRIFLFSKIVKFTTFFKGDEILTVNGRGVQGLSHQQVLFILLPKNTLNQSKGKVNAIFQIRTVEHSKIDIQMVLYSYHPSPGNPAVQKHQVWGSHHLHCKKDHAV